MNPDDLEWEPPSEAEMKLIAARRERSDQISKLMSNYLLKGYKMLGSVCLKCDTILLQDRQGVNYCVACSELDSDTTKDDPVISETAAISMAKELELASAAASTPSQISHPVAGATSALAEMPAAKNAPTVSFLSCPLQEKSEAVHSEGPNSSCRLKDEEDAPFLSMSSIDVQSYTATTNYDAAPSLPQPNPSNSSISNVQMKTVPVKVSGDSEISMTAAQEDTSKVSGNHLKLADDSVHVNRLIAKIQWASSELQGTHSIEYSIHLCQLIKIAGEAIVALRNARV